MLSQSGTQAAKWVVPRPHNLLLPWGHLSWVTIDSRDRPHAEKVLTQRGGTDGPLSVSALGMTNEQWIQLFPWGQRAIQLRCS